MAPPRRDGDRRQACACRAASVLVAALTTAFWGTGAAFGYPCSQPVSDGSGPVASDCVALLRAAVGTAPCVRPCACDVDGTGATTARDALYCLRYVVGEDVALECSRCNVQLPTAFAQVFADLDVPWRDGFVCDDCPERLLLHVYLDIDGTGSVSFARDDLTVAPLATQTPVTWSSGGDVVSLAPRFASVFPSGVLRWDTFELSLVDRDGDYVLDEGDGRIVAAFEQGLGGDVFSAATIDGGFTTNPDTIAPTLALYRPRMRISRELFVSEAPLLVSSEPLRGEDVSAGVQLLVDGEPVDSDIEIVSGGGPLLTQAWVHPKEFLPFDAVIELATGATTDLAGNLASWSGEPLHTMLDPGSANTNLGFESTGGWSGLESCGRFQIVQPTEGTLQACLLDFAELSGYLDLPATAREVAFSVAVLAIDPYTIDTDHVIVRVVHPTRTIAAFNALVPSEQLVPYTCDGWRDCAYIAPRDVVVDVADFAGDRIFLHAEARSVPPFTWYALFLDDIRIR